MLKPSIAAMRLKILGGIIRGFHPGYRRIMMLSSLIAGLTNNRPEQQFVRNLDHALHLSRGGEDSLVFPARLSRVFWGNLSIFQKEVEVLRDINAEQEARVKAAKVILVTTPEHFRYAPIDEIVADLLKYFDYIAGQKAVQ